MSDETKTPETRLPNLEHGLFRLRLEYYLPEAWAEWIYAVAKKDVRDLSAEIEARHAEEIRQKDERIARLMGACIRNRTQKYDAYARIEKLEEEIRRVRREAYEDALAIMSQNHRFFDGMDRAMMQLREKAGKL